MPSEKRTPLDETISFQEQREFLAPYMPLYSYFIDWLRTMLWELQQTTSPFVYAARVGLSQKILERTNLEHVKASQTSLVRVVRNLFPYDKIDSSAEVLGRLLAMKIKNGSTVNRLPFRVLNDRVIKSDALIKLRYDVLSKALTGYVLSVLQILREALDEEIVPDGLEIAFSVMLICREDLINLKRWRELLFLDFPPDHLTSVSDQTVSIQGKLHRRNDVPRDVEPELIAQYLAKVIIALRGKLAMILLRAKEVQTSITQLRSRYDAQIEQLSLMVSTLQTITGGDWTEVLKNITEFQKKVAAKFDLKLYLAPDVLEDLSLSRSLYRNGMVAIPP